MCSAPAVRLPLALGGMIHAVADNKTVVVGRSEKAPFLAYGDDSRFGEILTYAFVIVRRCDRQRFEKLFRQLRKRQKIPTSTPVHCRVLFHEKQREKAGLAHISDDIAKMFVEQTISILNRVPGILRYSYANLDQTGMPDLGSDVEFEFEGENGPSVHIHRQQIDPKWLQGLLSQSCWAVPPDGSNGPPASQCEIVVGRDATMVPVGTRKRQAHSLSAGFSDIGAEEGTVHRIEPRVSESNEDLLHQVADVCAYTVAHALSQRADQRFFREQLSRVKYWSRSAFSPAPALRGDEDATKT